MPELGFFASQVGGGGDGPPTNITAVQDATGVNINSSTGSGTRINFAFKSTSENIDLNYPANIAVSRLLINGATIANVNVILPIDPADGQTLDIINASGFDGNLIIDESILFVLMPHSNFRIIWDSSVNLWQDF